MSTLRSLYLTSTASRPPLRVGLLLDGPACAAFEARIIDDIVKSNFARLALVVYNAEARPRPVSRAPLPVRLLRLLRNSEARRLMLYSLYLKLDGRRVPPDADPLAPIDCRPRLDGVEALEVEPIAKGFTHRFLPEDLARIEASGLDVLLRFGFNILRGGILNAARYGVWSFHHGDNEYYRGGPSHFWELYEGNPVSGVTLQVLTDELDGGLVLCKSLFATTPGLSLARNRYGPYWGSTHLVIQKLHELHQHGWEHVRSRGGASAPYKGRRRIYKRPTNVEMARWLAPAVIRKAATRPFCGPRLRHWKVAIRAGRTPVHAPGNGADMRGFAWIDCPRGHFYADPFLITRDGKTWLFFEDFLYAESRGVISCAEVLAGGGLGPVRRCLARDYHLSYPMVFEVDGDVFMIPESIANGTVELYRATAFPERWRLEKVLHRLPAVDTTVWHDDGRWWFFAAVPEPIGHCATLFLFHAASLTSEWTSHPANPISTDVRRARGAGAIFAVGSHRFRPSQDCTRSYGRSFALNEIVTLTPERYHERPVLTVEPSWSKRLIGTHTYNQSGGVEVVDGCTLVHPASVL
jgi:hypothetical protein